MRKRSFAAALVLALASSAGYAQGAPADLVPIKRVAPEYPRKAARAGISGWVDVRIVVDRDGTVRTAQVVAAEPKGAFDEAALNAVVHWRFQPRAVETEIVQRFGFQLPPPPPRPEITPEVTPEAAPEPAS